MNVPIPTAIRIPNGKLVPIGMYARTWKFLLQPERDLSARFPGWDHFPTEGRTILANMRGMLMDIINRHDRTAQHTCSERRLFTKIRNAALRGAIVYRCRECDAVLHPLNVNPNNRESRFCNAACRGSYWR